MGGVTVQCIHVWGQSPPAGIFLTTGLMRLRYASWQDWFLSASLYFSKRGAYWDMLCRDVVGRWLVGCHGYGTLIGNPTPGIQWYKFRPPGVTPNRGMGPPWGAFCQITLTSCLDPQSHYNIGWKPSGFQRHFLLRLLHDKWQGRALQRLARV